MTGRLPALLRLGPRTLWRLALQAWRLYRRQGLAALWLKLRTYDLDGDALYRDWVKRFDSPGGTELARLSEAVAALDEPPTISVLMPVYRPDRADFEAAVASVRAQVYAHWQLVIADDASGEEWLTERLNELASADDRIRIARREENGHIAAATMSAAALADGAYLGFMDQDDLLAAHALAETALALAADPAIDALYTDEDKIDGAGTRHDPHFKPDWDPDLLLQQNYPSHLSIIRRELFDAVGGLVPGTDGAQDQDLWLRIARHVPEPRIRHLPRILYHWRRGAGSTAATDDAKDYALEAAEAAVRRHLESTGDKAEVTRAGAWLTVRRPLPAPAPRIAVIVPTRDRPELLGMCLDGVMNRTDYPDLELLVVDNGSTDKAALALMEQTGRDPRLRILKAPGPFNFAALNNFAAGATDAPLLCLLNNDVEPTEPGWLQALAADAIRPGIGAVGARLLYPDGRLQHAGIATGIGGIAGHPLKGLDGRSPGPHGRVSLARRVGAVTAACLVTRREVWQAVGGMDAENLPVAFNDVDYCLKVRERGLAVLYQPAATLIHHESASRGLETRPADRPRIRAEEDYMQRRWGDQLRRDPAWNPNLSLESEQPRPAFPPRRPLAW